ncbi:MAG: molybdate ABC transporter substrate-binding protein [Candidatus Metalachnospira sp.]|nr:molybdate ABC transporter substrate-binding protein [Candidatus Metalachnospira sp.]
MKKFLCVLTSALLAMSLTVGCSTSKTETKTDTKTEDTKEAATEKGTEATSQVIVFAAASMTETMNKIAEMYKEVDPSVEIVYNFDSSGTLKTQIQEGADCDIFISAAQKQMNQLDVTQDAEANPDKLDFVNADTRFNLVSNSVVLVTPKGNPAGLTSFDEIGTDKVKLIALGNSDVPVGQYSEEIFTYMKIWDSLNSEGKITFGTNVKEVLAQVEEGAVDCGVVYSTDAATSDKVDVVATAPEGSHKAITYPAAILKTSKNAEKAKEFLDYLKTDDCTAVFKAAGFGIPK